MDRGGRLPPKRGWDLPAPGRNVRSRPMTRSQQKAPWSPSVAEEAASYAEQHPYVKMGSHLARKQDASGFFTSDSLYGLNQLHDVSIRNTRMNYINERHEKSAIAARQALRSKGLVFDVQNVIMQKAGLLEQPKFNLEGMVVHNPADYPHGRNAQGLYF